MKLPIKLIILVAILLECYIVLIVTYYDKKVATVKCEVNYANSNH